jgi:hypothetical protein
MTPAQYANKPISKVATQAAYEWLWHLIRTRYPNGKEGALLPPDSHFAKTRKNKKKNIFYCSELVENVIIYYYNLIDGYEVEKAPDKGRWIDKSYSYRDGLGRVITVNDGVFIKQKNVKVGTSDIKVTKFVPPGLRQIMWLEVKVGKDRQSDEQKAFEALCKERGERYRIVKSVDDFLDFIGWPVLNRVEVRAN